MKESRENETSFLRLSSPVPQASSDEDNFPHLNFAHDEESCVFRTTFQKLFVLSSSRNSRNS